MAARRTALATDAPDVRAQVLAAAMRGFASQGFEATSLQAVADEVGVAKQSLLHYFPSKDALRQAVLDQMLAHWNEQLPRMLLAVTAEDRFEGVTRELVAFFLTDPDRARLVMREALDRPAAIRELMASHVRPWVAAIAEFVRKGQHHGEHFDDVDPEAYVLAVLQSVIASVATAQITEGVLGNGASASSQRAGTQDTTAARRLVREVLRVARKSLFVAAAPAPARSPRETPKRGAKPPPQRTPRKP